MADCRVGRIALRAGVHSRTTRALSKPRGSWLLEPEQRHGTGLASISQTSYVELGIFLRPNALGQNTSPLYSDRILRRRSWGSLKNIELPQQLLIY